MSKPLFNLPDTILDPKQANSLSSMYLDGKTPREQLKELEQQTLFWLLVEALEYPEIEFKSVCLGIPDDPDEIIALEFEGQDPSDDLSVYDETEEVGAQAMAFMDQIGVMGYDSSFTDTLSKPLTHANKWKVAASLFGKDTSSKMEQAYLAKNTPKASSKSKRPRM